MPVSNGGGDRLLCYLFFLSNLCVSNMLWVLQSTTITTLHPDDDASLKIASVAPFRESQTHQREGKQASEDDNVIITQAFVISSTLQRAVAFQARNHHALQLHGRNSSTSSDDNFLQVTWFPAANGYDQITLDSYAQLTGFAPLNASKFSAQDPKRKRGYSNSHTQGCFMSHWNLLRLAREGWMDCRPSALWIMEDDATCATSTLQRLEQEILPMLPDDWDLLFLGGKPFSYHTLDPIQPDLVKEKTKLHNIQTDWNRTEFRHWACQGGLGRSATGPFAPQEPRRHLSLEQPYWRTHYITNTHSYVVNPARIERVLDLLQRPRRDYPVPVDIGYANGALDGELNVYMSSMEYCIQDEQDDDTHKLKNKQRRDKPTPWMGFYYHKDLAGQRFDEIWFPECPNKI